MSQNFYKKINFENGDISHGEIITNIQNPMQQEINWKAYSKKTLKKQLSKFGFYLGKSIGEGSYSKVYYSEYDDKKTGTGKSIAACKVIDRRSTSRNYLQKFLPRELDVIKNLEHKHIVSIYGIIEHGPFICVFMDYCRYGDLLDRIKNHGVLSEKHTQIYFSQLVSAINYLHSNNISHRDVKCENVLLVNRYNVKLTDFTFARHFKEKSYLAFSETYCGSTAYASPEVLKGTRYNPYMYDLWSLGCVLFIMVTGTMPFDDDRTLETIRKQENRDFSFPPACQATPQIKSIIRSLMEPIVSRRCKINELMSNPWILL